MEQPEAGRTLHWDVSPEDAAQRLDVFLARRRPELSRSAAARLIETGAVVVTGRKVKTGLLLRAGDQVDFRPPLPMPARTEAQALPLSVLYQDETLAVVNKPAGMVTHPAPGHPGETLVNALLYHLDRLSGIGGEARPGIVHRLDKDTSGLLLVAKNDAAHRALSSGIQERSIRRYYDAVVWGQPREDRFCLETRLGRDPRDRKRFAVVRSGGRLASTEIERVRCFDEFSLLRLKLNTGRTHQIRVHCRHLGTPVVGDRMYGKSSEAKVLSKLGLPRPDRQLLHARRLEFVHPFTGRPLSFEAPWPEDFIAFMQALDES